ncbi:MAG: hypothetical protein ABR577_02695 [Pyrinomonadaceae bacterium]
MKDQGRMRWKLALVVSLIAGGGGAGLTIAIVLAFFGSTRRLAAFDLAVAATLLVPLIAIISAGAFVYRHTARHRPLQAMGTALLTFLLILTIFIACSILLSERMPAPPASMPPRIIN